MAKDVAGDAELIAAIYEAALDPARWEGALGLIARRLGATRALLQDAYLSRADALLCAHNISENEVDHYRGRCWSSDPWIKALQAEGIVAGKVYAGGELVDAASLSASDCYRDFLAPLEIRHACGVVLQDQWRGLVPPTYLSFYRPASRGEFGRTERARLARLIPHLRAATEHFWRNDRALGLHPAEVAILERLAVGVVVVSQHGRVVFVNPSAAEILRRNDGLAIERGRLASAAVREGWRLNRIVSTASLPGATLSGVDAAVAVTRSGAPWPYLVQLVPLARGAGSGAAVAFITDPAPAGQGQDAPEISAADLTQAERRVYEEFRLGSSRRQIAARLALSPNTVHAHLKNIFAKTGATRQADLAWLGLLRLRAAPSKEGPRRPRPQRRRVTSSRTASHYRPKRGERR